MRLLRTLPAPALATLVLAAAAAAQPRPCAAGAADGDAMLIEVTLAGTLGYLSPLVDSALAERGYTVPDSLRRRGLWRTAPRYTWPAGFEKETWSGGAHPGVELTVQATRAGDSTDVQVAARVLCGMTPPPGEKDAAGLEGAAELMTVMDVLTALQERVERAGPPPAGGSFSLSVPDSVAEFGFRQRHDYPDPAAGTQVRYLGPDSVVADVFVYPGVPADSSCPAACARQRVDAEAEAFVSRDVPEMVRRGMIDEARPTADEMLSPAPDDPWRAGRHVTLAVEARGATRTSHYYLWSFPGYMVKVRSTFPARPGRDELVRAFVADLLGKLVRRDG